MSKPYMNFDEKGEQINQFGSMEILQLKQRQKSVKKSWWYDF